jgi:hypothetical protein
MWPVHEPAPWPSHEQIYFRWSDDLNGFAYTEDWGATWGVLKSATEDVILAYRRAIALDETWRFVTEAPPPSPVSGWWPQGGR